MERRILLDYISNKIIGKKKIIGSRCLIVGIEGQGCSGKSVLAKDLKSILMEKGFNTDVVSIDDFCNKRDIRYSNEYPLPKQHYYKNFNYEYFEDSILKMARDFGHLSFDEFVLNTKTDQYDKELQIHVTENGILLVEGVFIYRNAFKKYYDYSILLHVDQEEQLRRGMQRDLVKSDSVEMLLNKYKDRYIPAYQLYKEMDNPEEFADIVIDNTSFDDPSITKDL